jgi:adenylate kinase
MPITYAFVTSNEKKFAEYKLQLARYGREVFKLSPVKDDQKTVKLIWAYLLLTEEKERFVLWEASNLYQAEAWEKGNLVVSSLEIENERVYNVSTLEVYSLDEHLELTVKTYQAAIEGHLNLSARNPHCDDPLWWDDIFVANRSQASYLEERDLWGKVSARQHAIGQFVCDHVIFSELRDLSFTPHKPSQAVDFSPELSLARVLKNSSFLKTAKLENSPWGLGNLLTHITARGAFFRSANSNRAANYFCPPLSGISRTKKPDPFWQFTFQLHDIFHQAIPDLVFNGEDTPRHRNFYVAARLMSEAFTLVLADMLFVENMKEHGFNYDFSTRKINPLFNALTLPEAGHREQLKALLKANVYFANLGDDSLYRRLLKAGAVDNFNGQEALESYTQTYKHFFIPDLLWSVGNYDDMTTRKESFAYWTKLAGPELLERALLPLLSNVVEELEAQGKDLSSYESAVKVCFEYLFERVLSPQLAQPASKEENKEDVAISNAFLRYMIGQLFMYAHYRQVPTMAERGQQMATLLRETQHFGQEQIAQIRKLYESDLGILEQAELITKDETALYSQLFPIFSPRYLSYNFDKTAYASLQEAIEATFPTSRYG